MSYLKQISGSFLFLLVFSAGCAYYNTMFNAKEKYESGQKRIKENINKEISPEIRKDFSDAIDKCWKLINIYGDSSTYADDALLLIGKGHYQMEEYVKSERHLRQFLSRYQKSDLIAEANLWLGKSLVRLDRDDEAILYLNEAIEADESSDMTAQAYLSLGNINFKQQNYKKARTFLDQVIDISRDDDLEAQAQYLIAESFFEEGNYEEAAQNFDRVSEYKTQIDFLFNAFIRRIDCMVEMKQDDLAIELLEENSINNKFLHKVSVLRARIGNILKDQGKFIEATEEYDDVLRLYPRTEGSAIAAYGMAQLMEFAYGSLDSAKSLYQRVGQEYRQSEFTERAENRSRILDEYKKIESNIQHDQDDLEKLKILEIDTTLVENNGQMSDGNPSEPDDKAKQKKPTVRSQDEIVESLQKNRFAKAEFFLLTLANYDSAIALYTKFTNSSLDTLLVPKAYYALYYIYTYEVENAARADSIRQIILRGFPETSYAAYFKIDKSVTADEKKDESPYKYMYLQGEALMADDRFEEAVDIFTQIAVEDSGSEVATKARYASAWIYENKLEDLPGAIHAYTILANEYPKSDAGKIAQNKIKVPENEVIPVNAKPDSLGADQVVPEPTAGADTSAQDVGIQNWPTPDEVGQATDSLQEATPDSVN
jgi:TolA-binding protein